MKKDKFYEGGNKGLKNFRKYGDGNKQLVR